MELILYFFLYSFFGWLCECIYCSIPAHTFINRGFLAGPYCPIYGCGALAVLHIRELRQEFANASITLLQENLSDAVARVLDSTNADEILLERIERLRQRITSLHTKRKRTHIRLQKAFPTRIEAISRINAERLFSIINERRKKEDGK